MSRNTPATLLVLFALLLLLAPLGCTTPERAQQQDIDPSTPIKVACIGDSITYGAGIIDRGNNSYPTQLGRLLGENYIVMNYGVNAATLLKQGNKPYWNLNQFKAAQDFQPNIVVIKLGTNDTKPDNWKHKDQYKPDYLAMIKTFKDLDSKPTVYICYPAPVFPERWGISDKTVREEVIPLLDQIAKAGDVTIIDLYNPLKDKPDLVPDKVHPNAEGATIIAQTVKQAITKR